MYVSTSPTLLPRCSENAPRGPRGPCVCDNERQRRDRRNSSGQLLSPRTYYHTSSLLLLDNVLVEPAVVCVKQDEYNCLSVVVG